MIIIREKGRTEQQRKANYFYECEYWRGIYSGNNGAVWNCEEPKIHYDGSEHYKCRLDRNP